MSRFTFFVLIITALVFEQSHAQSELLENGQMGLSLAASASTVNEVYSIGGNISVSFLGWADIGISFSDLRRRRDGRSLGSPSSLFLAAHLLKAHGFGLGFLLISTKINGEPDAPGSNTIGGFVYGGNRKDKRTATALLVSAGRVVPKNKVFGESVTIDDEYFFISASFTADLMSRSAVSPTFGIGFTYAQETVVASVSLGLFIKSLHK